MFVNRSFRKLIILGVALAMVSGCATSDSTLTKIGGGILGAAAGAVLGAGAFLVTGDKETAIAVMAATTLAGAAAGAALGAKVAEKKEAYIQQEDELTGKIRVAQEKNTELEAYNNEMISKIEALEAEITTLKSQNLEEEAQVTALKAKQDEITAKISQAEELIAAKNEELTALGEYQKTLASLQDQENVAKLDKEVSTLKNSIAMLDTNSKQMAKLVESLNVRK